MGFIRSLTEGAINFRADVTGTPAAWDDYWYSPIGYSSASGVRVNADSAKRIATVLACVGVIGRNLGMMPIKIYTEAPDGSKRLVSNHPLYDVLYSRPNSQQTAFEFKQMMQGHVELRGNAYAKILPGPRGAVDQLIPMHPDRVRIERLANGKLRYLYNNPLTNETEKLMEEEVFHLRNFSDDGFTGQSTVAMAIDLFGVALAQQDYTARFLKNDARPPIVFEQNFPFKNKSQEDSFLDSWQKGHTAENRGKAGLLPNGITAKVLGVNPSDQQLLDARKFSRIEICSIFGVPPHLIGETEKTATYASVEQFNIMYAVHCILPRLVMWEQAIQRDLITNERYFAKFGMGALLRGDTASRFAAYKVAIENGWMCQDEVRLLEDLNPIPNGAGKKFWRPVNWAPLDQVTTPAPTPQGDLPDDTDTEDPSDDNTAGDGTQGKEDPKTIQARLQLLANSAADRCVRKEVAGLRKLTSRGFDSYQIEEFYTEQLEFVGTVLALESDALSVLRQEYFQRASELCQTLGEGGSAATAAYIDNLAVRESLRLSKFAVEGVAA
ncbi:MAG: phage portal protein [Acidobacteria bacterium]|nr:phage portal protein [Acidobacteriota bacterium]